MKQKISILGCGWLGLSLAESLIYQGFEVQGSTTSKNKLADLEKIKINSFLINLNQLEGNISGFLNSDILIIAIPEKSITAFTTLISHIENSKIEKVIFISSTSVYQNNNQEVDESTPVRDFALSRIENMFSSNTNFKSTIIRFGGLFGYTRNPANFISKTKPMQNPEGFVNLIHRDDCIQIIEQIMNQNCWSETFNACADTHPTRRQFYTYVALGAKRQPPIFNENSLNEYKIVRSDKLKSTMDFTFKHSNLLDVNRQLENKDL